MAENGVIAELNQAIDSDETPRWARPILRCMRDDHQRLAEHLSAHRDIQARLNTVLWATIGVLVTGLVAWVLSARLPGVW